MTGLKEEDLNVVLMVYIDDATTEIISLHFSKTESLLAYYGTVNKLGQEL